MDISTLKSHIVNNTPDKFYIFTGPEWQIQKIYIQKMADKFNKPYKYIDSISSIYSKLSNRSFISQSYMYVVRDDNDIQTNETVQAGLEKLLGDNILILLLTNPDKRTKFYKKYSDKICTFDYLVPNILAKYIQKEVDLSTGNIERLMSVCENDYGRCLLEIDKIKHLKQAHAEEDDNIKFAELLRSGMIYTPPKDAIFEFIDAILDRKKNVYELYENCKAVNEAVMVIISVLYNNAKAVLQVQAYTGKDMANGTGLTPFQINNAKKHCGKRRNGELIYIMKLCQKCQEGIVTGKIEEEFVVDYILGEVL